MKILSAFIWMRMLIYTVHGTRRVQYMSLGWLSLSSTVTTWCISDSACSHCCLNSGKKKEKKERQNYGGRCRALSAHSSLMICSDVRCQLSDSIPLSSYLPLPFLFSVCTGIDGPDSIMVTMGTFFFSSLLLSVIMGCPGPFSFHSRSPKTKESRASWSIDRNTRREPKRLATSLTAPLQKKSFMRCFCFFFWGSYGSQLSRLMPQINTD